MTIYVVGMIKHLVTEILFFASKQRPRDAHGRASVLLANYLLWQEVLQGEQYPPPIPHRRGTSVHSKGLPAVGEKVSKPCERRP
jgi:hypothetical protein